MSLWLSLWSCYIRLLVLVFAAASALVFQLFGLALTALLRLCLRVSSVSYEENSHAFRNGHGTTLHKGIFCAAASIFIGWLKFLQLKTRHPLVETMVLGFFG